MAFIESNITIWVDETQDIAGIENQIKSLISSTNGKITHVNIIETDDPMSVNPIYVSKQ